ncbi:MAG: hypothetical protein AAGA67_06865 [Cyanobacteria bacterium P01_F01_bin.153]
MSHAIEAKSALNLHDLPRQRFANEAPQRSLTVLLIHLLIQELTIINRSLAVITCSFIKTVEKQALCTEQS